MKYFIFLLFALFPLVIKAQMVNKWIEINNPDIIKYTALSYSISDEKNIVFHTIASNGDFKVSFDSLISWKVMPSIKKTGVYPRLSNILSDNKFIIIGDSLEYLGNFELQNRYKNFGYFKVTSDGGESWRDVILDSNTYLRQIAMLDDKHGYIVKEPRGNYFNTAPNVITDSLLVTGDFWNTWETLPLPEGVKHVWEALITSNDHFIIKSLNARDNYNTFTLYRTNDGGRSWEEMGLPKEPDRSTGIRKLEFLDFETGIAAGGVYKSQNRSEDIIYKTEDGGKTWRKVHEAEIYTSRGLNDMDFADALNGIAVGGQSKILRTTDGGETWFSEQPPPQSVDLFENYNQVLYPDANLALIVLPFKKLALFNGEKILKAPYFTNPKYNTTYELPVDGNFLEWEAIEGSANYRLQICEKTVGSGNADFDQDIIIDTTLSAFTFDFTRLQYYRHYTCRVNAFVGADTSEWSPLRILRTFDSPGQLKTPVQIYPLNGQLGCPSKIEFEWTNIERADSYEFMIADNPFFVEGGEGFSVLVKDSNIVDNKYIVEGLPPDSVLYWNVRAVAEDQKSYWANQLTGAYVFKTASIANVIWNLSILSNEIKVFPNPLPDGTELTVTLPLHSASVVRSELLDMLGRSVGETYSQYSEAGRQMLRFKTQSGLPAGVYFLRVSAGKDVWVRKVIVLDK